MSETNDMTVKYQQHYNKVLNNTLTDTILKSVSYQANIQLANEIIAEQEKTIADLNDSIQKIKKESEDAVVTLRQELDSMKTGKTTSENSRISFLENNIKNQLETITKLQSELAAANKVRMDYENIKSQAASVDVFRKELVKERESHESTKSSYEQKIKELNGQIDLLKAPPKRKKANKTSILELVTLADNDVEITTNQTTKDGGTF
jgi:uncharacterized coiled-coil protein SlyX